MSRCPYQRVQGLSETLVNKIQGYEAFQEILENGFVATTRSAG